MSKKTQIKLGRYTSQNKGFQLKWWHKLIFLSPIIAIALIFKGNEWYESYMLNTYKDSTWAVLTIVTLTGVNDAFDTENVRLEYSLNGKTYTKDISVPVNHRYVIGELGLPLMLGQRYKLYFASNKPHISKIDLAQPDSITINSYIREASYIVQTLIKNISFEKAQCITNSIFNQFKYDGLAYIFFNDEYVVENFKHNSQTFSLFWEKPQIKNIIKNCLAEP